MDGPDGRLLEPGCKCVTCDQTRTIIILKDALREMTQQRDDLLAALVAAKSKERA